jgi:tight adherence protein C
MERGILIGGALAVVALVSLVLAVRTAWRRRMLAPAGRTPDADARVTAVHLGKLGARLRPSDPEELGALRHRLMRAGLNSDDAVDLYLTVRLLLLVVLVGAAGFILLWPAVGLAIRSVVIVVLALALGVGPSLWIDARTKERLFQIGRGLPAALDMLVICLDAGLNLDQALGRVVAGGAAQRQNVFGQELGIALEEMRAGLPLSESLRRMSQRLDHPDVQSLAALVGQVSALGGNVAGALRAHSDAMRVQRISFLEEETGKATAKLTLPLVLCLLLSMMLLLFGPAIVSVSQSFKDWGG